MAKLTHELATIALGYARCQCGWEYRVTHFKNKSDEDLAIETGTAFEEHRRMK